MSNNYIPSRESELDPYLENFSDKITASPTSYGLQAADATAISTAVNAWHVAYLAAQNPTTRTPATIQTKNLQKANVLSVVRTYAAQIRANVAVSDALKIDLGLRVRDLDPTPVPPPSSFPMLSVTNIGVGEQFLAAADQYTPTKRARPAGTAGLLLFRAIDTAPVTNPEDCRFMGFVTKATFKSTFQPGDNGKTVTYFARWTNGKGELGPWSPPASRPIAA